MIPGILLHLNTYLFWYAATTLSPYQIFLPFHADTCLDPRPGAGLDQADF